MFNGGVYPGSVATADYFRGRTTTNVSQRLYQLQADWTDTGVFDSPYSDLTDYVLHLAAERGRDNPNPLRGRCTPGKLTVTLDNRSGIFSAQNALSPLFGQLIPGHIMRWRAIAPSPYQRWWGKIVDFKASRIGALPVMIIECRGALDELSNVKVNPPADTGSLTGTIVGKILDDAGFPSTRRTIDAGQTTTSQWFIDDRFALDASRDMEETELGLLSEDVNGNIVFRDRAYRAGGARLTSQATYSDSPSAAFKYSSIELPSEIKDLVNQVRATVTPYTTAALADIWTLSGETPTIGPGASKTFIATVSGSVLYVAAWTTPVATTDYTVSGVALGDLSIVVAKYAAVMFITITNNHATNTATMTLLKARGTGVTAGSPTLVRSSNAASIAKYQTREYPLPSKWLPNTNTAQSYADSIVSANKDPIAVVELRFNVGISVAMFSDLMTRDIHDRVTVIAQETRNPLGLAGDFFIENIKDEWDPQKGNNHIVTMQCSAASTASASWILGTSVLGTNTVIGF